MTIIQPNQQKSNINILLIIAITLLVSGAVLSIFMYNHIVDLRHAAAALEEKLEIAQTANVDLKNQLYQITDSRQISYVVEKLGLIEEKRPAFVEEKNNLLADVSLR